MGAKFLAAGSHLFAARGRLVGHHGESHAMFAGFIEGVEAMVASMAASFFCQFSLSSPSDASYCLRNSSNFPYVSSASSLIVVAVPCPM